MIPENGIGYATLRYVLWGGMWPGQHVLHGTAGQSRWVLLERVVLPAKSSPGEIGFAPVRAIPDGPKMNSV